MATQTSAKLLPRIGDEVMIDGLKSAKHHNGKTGKVAGFDGKLERYRVTLEEKGGSPSQSLGVKLANLAVHEQSSSNHSLHVLIPCHIASDVRVLSFQRCVKSILYQVDSEFAVFVGLSGPSDYRQLALKVLALLASKSPSQRWYVQDEDVEGRPQMEHLRHLLKASLEVNEDTLLTFVDNDDMCHPLRFRCMQDAYQSMDPLPEPCTLAIPCKLLLNPSLNPAESKLENFVDMREPMDFDVWRKNSFADEKVT